MNKFRRVVPKVFVLLCLCFNAFMVPYHESLPRGQEFIAGIDSYEVTFVVVASILVAQTGFVAVVAGLASPRWIGGFSLAYLLASIGYVSCAGASIACSQYGFIELSETNIRQYCLGLLFVPATVFGLGLPFWLMRAIRGWHLGASPCNHLSRKITRRDSLLMTAIALAVVLQLAFPFGYMDSIPTQYWPLIGLMLLCASGLSLLFLPASAISLLIPRFWLRWLVQLGLLFILAIGTLTTLVFMHVPMFEDWWKLVLSVFLTGVIFWIGMESLLIAGFRIRRLPSEQELEDLRAEAERQSAAEQTQSRKQSELAPAAQALPFWVSTKGVRLCSSLIFGVALTAGTVRLTLSGYHFWLAGAGERLIADFEASGGDVILDGREQIWGLEFPASATNDDVAKYAGVEDVVYLDLSQTQVNDSVVPTILAYSNLEKLNLSVTKLSEAVVIDIVDETALSWLNLEGISFSTVSLQELLLRSESLEFLGLSGTGLTFSDAQSDLFEALPPSVALGDLHLTDDDVSKLFQSEKLTSLDLHNNDLTGEFLISRGTELTFGELSLEGNPISDESIANARSKGLRLDSLSVGADNLSDAILPELAKIPRRTLAILDDSFSEQAVVDYKESFSKLITLRLNGKQFSSKAMHAGLQSGAFEIDMSGSSISSESILTMVEHGVELSNGQAGVLDLSYTSIDDRILPLLARSFALFELNLSHTEVTAKGIKGLAGNKIGKVIVAPNQFSESEIERIRDNIAVAFYSTL